MLFMPCFETKRVPEVDPFCAPKEVVLTPYFWSEHSPKRLRIWHQMVRRINGLFSNT